MSESAGPDKFRVLIVEDDPFIARLILTNLEKANLNGRVAKDGVEGLKDFKEFDPHLVITDIMMPGIDGREVCTIIREISMVPIIMITAGDTSFAEVASLKAGADDYIAKPFDPQVLTMRVIAQLRRVYRYDATIYMPAEEAAADPHATAPGWMTCQTCGHKAPREVFTQENSRAQRFMLCPNCRETANFLYA